jgi:hypothetical protein
MDFSQKISKTYIKPSKLILKSANFLPLSVHGFDLLFLTDELLNYKILVLKLQIVYFS